ncbi:MAG TPA: TetR/AcrR family transcriptional regulator [Acidimicrobiales bacterium]|nr:TetR/AcrR family transcriptional regulator [Acidimicrobiales bacterium]
MPTPSTPEATPEATPAAAPPDPCDCGPGERRPGRPRDARAADAIMCAAVEVLAERGPAGFTVDAVAARAGCGKATIYRRWPSRASLMLETAQRMGLEPDDIDSGSLREDLVTTLVQLAAKLRNTPAGRIIPAVVGEAAVNPDMRAVLGGFINERRIRPREIVARGVARGQLPPDTDVELVLDLLGGMVFFRTLIACEELDEADIRTAVDHVLQGFAAG